MLIKFFFFILLIILGYKFLEFLFWGGKKNKLK